MRKVKTLHFYTVKKYKCKGITEAITKNFSLGFKHITVNVQNLISVFH